MFLICVLDGYNTAIIFLWVAGNLIHVAKYLPRKSPTLNNKKTVTGVKYLADHSEFDFWSKFKALLEFRFN